LSNKKSQTSGWRYKAAYWLFALGLIFMTGRTIGGTLNWFWTSLFAPAAPITTIYDTTHPKAPSDYYWPN
jgi:hypothetical protein